MNDDATLLRRYAEEGSETAFAELVRRHVDLVYGAALRRTGGDAHSAKDVAQKVFTSLARGAGRLSHHTMLSAWLHTATRNAAVNLMISEQRRTTRESEAVALESANAGGAGSDWEKLRPLLDTAIDELPEADRAVVVLRFLERRAFAEVGAALRVSEDAARMRTERALGKLRAALIRRGITSTAAALGAAMLAQPLVCAPSGLAVTLASQSLAAAGAGFLATLSSLMTTKLITTAALAAVAAFAAGSYFGPGRHVEAPAPESLENPAQTRTIESLGRDNRRLTAAVASLTADVSRLNDANAKLNAQAASPAPAPRRLTLGMSHGDLQQAMLNNLRQIAAARDQYMLEYGHAAGNVQDLVGAGRYIKTVRTVDGEDYSGLSMTGGGILTVTTPDGMSVTYDPSGATTTHPDISPEELRLQELTQKVQAPINAAVAAYRAANNGSNPPNDQALVPYFATPQEGADFVEFIEAQKAPAH